MIPTHYDDFFAPLDADLGFAANVDLAAVEDELAAVSRDLEVAALPRIDRPCRAVVDSDAVGRGSQGRGETDEPKHSSGRLRAHRGSRSRLAGADPQESRPAAATTTTRPPLGRVEHDDRGGDRSAEDVTVTAAEYEFDLSATPTEETTSVTFDNQGKEFHVMVFAKLNEGFTLDQAIKLEGEKGSAETIAQTQAEPGETKTVEVKKPLEPGDYAILCPIGGPDGPHYELGQLVEFEL